MEKENLTVPDPINENSGLNEVPGENVSMERKNLEKRCMNCQAVILPEQLFCPECGMALKKVCPNCKTTLEDGQIFCPSCGQKVGQENNSVATDTIMQFNVNVEKQKNKKKLLPVILGIIGVCVVVIYFLCTIFLNPQYYIEKGNYEMAYKVASASDKEDILRENIVAVISNDCIDSLKDSASFELRNAWFRFNETSRVVILEVAANNSYGNKVINYWYYSYDFEDQEYNLYTSFSDFREETSYSWDDSSERLEKLLKNIAKNTAESIVESGVKLSKGSVNTINQLFENDILEDVLLLSAIPKNT